MHKKVYASAYEIVQTLLTKMRKINNDIAAQTIYGTNLFNISVRVFSLSGCLPERTRGRPWGRLRVRIRSIEKTWSSKFYPAAQNFTNRMLFWNTHIFKTI